MEVAEFLKKQLLFEQVVAQIYKEDIRNQVIAITVLLNFCSGSDAFCQKVLDINLLDILHSMIDHPNIGSDTRREFGWALANIACGTTKQQELLLNHKIYGKILEYSKIPTPSLVILSQRLAVHASGGRCVGVCTRAVVMVAAVVMAVAM